MITLYYCNVLCYDDDDDDVMMMMMMMIVIIITLFISINSTGAISTNKPIALNKPTYTQLYKR